MEYSDGFEAGVIDGQAGQAQSLRGKSVEYRNGYSDGYFKGTRQDFAY